MTFELDESTDRLPDSKVVRRQQAGKKCTLPRQVGHLGSTVRRLLTVLEHELHGETPSRNDKGRSLPRTPADLVVERVGLVTQGPVKGPGEGTVLRSVLPSRAFSAAPWVCQCRVEREELGGCRDTPERVVRDECRDAPEQEVRTPTLLPAQQLQLSRIVVLVSALSVPLCDRRETARVCGRELPVSRAVDVVF